LDISINELTEIIRNIVGFKGKIVFDKSKPDGPQKKLTDVSRLKSFGWNCNPNLEDGLKDTYQWYVNHNK
jgi:GDP-L-fucose synthase